MPYLCGSQFESMFYFGYISYPGFLHSFHESASIHQPYSRALQNIQRR